VSVGVSGRYIFPSHRNVAVVKGNSFSLFILKQIFKT
jgi:hypothetical protein